MAHLHSGHSVVRFHWLVNTDKTLRTVLRNSVCSIKIFDFTVNSLHNYMQLKNFNLFWEL